jgi:hypothetical protein
MPDLKPRGISEIFDALRSENRARLAERHRRARYWMNNRNLRLAVAKLSNWVGKITDDDIRYLQTAAYANEAIHDLHALSQELQQLALALSDGWQITDQRQKPAGEAEE